MHRVGTHVSVAILGFGTVGQAVARRIVTDCGYDIRLACVCTRTLARADVPWLPAGVRRTTALDVALAPDVDIVVELIGGLSPAGHFVSRALQAGKSVVTANKQLIAHHGARLGAAARRAGRQLKFEAAVGAGIPVVRAIQDGLAGDRLHQVAGVLNGTTTYVLSRMEDERCAYTDALAEAQALGLAEADPAEDVEGLDARAKLVILTAIGLGRAVSPSAIRAESIAALQPFDLGAARALGCSIRQVARARHDGHGGALAAEVGPCLVDRSSPLGQTRGAENALVIEGSHGGRTVLTGRGAGGESTSVAVLSDIVAIARNPLARGCSWPRRTLQAALEEEPALHYVRAPRAARAGLWASLNAAHLSPRLVSWKLHDEPSEGFDAWTAGPCTRSRIERALVSSNLDRQAPGHSLAIPVFPLDRPDWSVPNFNAAAARSGAATHEGAPDA